MYGNRCTVCESHKPVAAQHCDDPLQFVHEYLAQFRAAPQTGLPRFCGGLVGYFGDETVRYIEGRPAKTQKPDPLGVPDILLMLSQELAIVDNLSGKLTLVVYADPARAGAYQEARRRLAELLAKLRTSVSIPASAVTTSEPAVSGFGEAAYL